jgi:hypothetical protein
MSGPNFVAFLNQLKDLILRTYELLHQALDLDLLVLVFLYFKYLVIV